MQITDDGTGTLDLTVNLDELEAMSLAFKELCEGVGPWDPQLMKHFADVTEEGLGYLKRWHELLGSNSSEAERVQALE